MTRSVDDLAARLRQALDALHRLSEGAGDAGLYANEAALHRIYSDVDEATAELLALVGTLTQERENYATALAQISRIDGTDSDETARSLRSLLAECHRIAVNALNTGVVAPDLRVRAEAAEAALADMRRALERIAEQQTKTIDWLRANGIVFDNLDDHWQKVAFSIYNDLCEVDAWAHDALGEGVDGKPRALAAAGPAHEEGE